MKRSKFLPVVLLGLLLFPGNAPAEIYLNLVHPYTVIVGEAFTVTVNLVSNGAVPPDVCSYQYIITYDDSKVLVEPLSQFQPPVTPQMDGEFYSRIGCDVDPWNCPTAPLLPMAFNCCGITDPMCPPPARFGFWDGSMFFCDVNGENCYWADPQAVSALAWPGRTSATFTFQALSPGCFDFGLLGTCPSEVGDCPVDPDILPAAYDITRVVNSRICVQVTPPVPALTHPGMLVSALGLITLALYLVRKYRRTHS